MVINLFKTGFLQMSVKSAGQRKKNIKSNDHILHFIKSAVFHRKKITSFILWSHLKNWGDVTQTRFQDNLFPIAGDLYSCPCRLISL